MVSGLIYAAIVAAWVAYLVPLWIRRREERIGTSDPASPSTRMIKRSVPGSTPGPDEDAERAAAERQSRSRLEPLDRTGQERPIPAAPVSPRVLLRRRRILFVLVSSVAATLATGWLGALPGWAPAVPGALLVAYVLVLRRATRARARSDARTSASSYRASYGVAARRSDGSLPWLVEQDMSFGHSLDDTEPQYAGATVAGAVAGATVAAPAVAAPAVSAPAVSAPAGPLAGAGSPVLDIEPIAVAMPADASAEWLPVPVPLPTYVTAPKARRSIRTIDLSQPGHWTSGRLEGEGIGGAGAVPVDRDPLPAWAGEVSAAGDADDADDSGDFGEARAVGG